MRLSTRRDPEQIGLGRRVKDGDQRGFSLIEILIAMLVLTLTVGGIAAASFSAGRGGKSANEKARLNVLATAFGEAVKALPYQECADAATYQNSFDSSESALKIRAEDLRVASGATLLITDVPLGPDCPGLDTGVQTVLLSVTINGRTLSRQVVKRTPDAAATQLDFTIKDPTNPANKLQRSGANDVQVVWGLASGGTSQIFQYEWWCDGSWQVVDPPLAEANIPPPDFVTNSPTDPAPECKYAAPLAGVVKMQRIALRVTESGTNRVGVKSEEFKLPTTLAPHNPPFAQITITSAKQCLTADKCSPNTDIAFASTGPDPVDGTILQWRWSFGDGTPAILCSKTAVSPADPTGVEHCKHRIHQYTGGGSYVVKLTVVDNFGVSSSAAIRNVEVSGTAVVRPTVTFTSSLDSAGGFGSSPQQVSFDATLSHANGYPPSGGIKSYYWDFGAPGGTADGPSLTNPTFEFPQSTSVQQYTVTLTVTDLNDVSNFATKVLTLQPFTPPINFVSTGAVSDIPWLLFNSGRNGYFDFQWRNIPRSPGDQVKLQIGINRASSICGIAWGSGEVLSPEIPAGPDGSVQTYRFQFHSNPAGWNGICIGDRFEYRARSIRVNSSGTRISSWSSLQSVRPR